MSRRDRDTDKGRAGVYTNSNDPKLQNSRVFIGNLPTDRVEREDLEEVFKKYGKIIGVTTFRGFGFVQFDKESDARSAVKGENGNLLKGKQIDVKMAAEGKKQQSNRSEPARRPPPRDEPRMRDRSPLRDFYRDDPYSKLDPDPYRRLSPRDPYLDRYDPYGLPSRDYPPRDLLRDPYQDLALAAPPPIDRPPYDCEIILTTKNARLYAELIERRLKEAGILSDIKLIPDELALPRAVEESSRRQIPFAIVLNAQNELHRSVTVNILHGTAQEHRNMPFEDAMTMVVRNFDSYIQELREKAVAPAASRDPPEFIPPDQQTHYLLNLLADNRMLTLEELDSVIEYLEKRRQRVIIAQGGPRGGLGMLGEEKSSSLHQMGSDMYNGSNSSQHALLQRQQALESMSVNRMQQGAMSSNTSINFDNPSVQKALDNLISSGPNLLRSINTSQSSQMSSGGFGSSSLAQMRGGMGESGLYQGPTSFASSQRSTGLASLSQYGQF